MLFLGAGASAAFDVPAMQELTKFCEDYLVTKGFTEIQNIRESLEAFGLVYDFEALLTLLQSFSQPAESVRASGPLTAFLAHQIQDFSSLQKHEAADYVEDLKRILVDKCQRARIDDATSHYRRLFEMFGEINGRAFKLRHNESSTLTGGFVLNTEPPRRTQDIFTINYDLIIEHVFEKEQLAEWLRHGFVLKGVRMLWSPQESYAWSGRSGAVQITNLVKLHGSIDQFSTERGIEKLTGPPGQGYYRGLIEKAEQLMIFPVHEKYVTRSPYYDLFHIFRTRLLEKTLCVIIGYSFRDEAVNNVLIDSVKKNRSLKLIYIGGDNAVENVKRVPELVECTLPITKKFGIDNLYVGLKDNIMNWYPQELAEAPA